MYRFSVVSRGLGARDCECKLQVEKLHKGGGACLIPHLRYDKFENTGMGSLSFTGTPGKVIGSF